MGNWKDRVPLQNGKNNIIKFALNAGMTHEQLLTALIDGIFADVFYNQALPGTADAGVAQIGTIANKSFFDSLIEECTALSNNLSYDVKMLQLQQILEGNHPNMMGGMIEAFYTTNNLNKMENVEVTTGKSGKCVFNGVDSSEFTWNYSGGSSVTGQGAGTSIMIATGVQESFKKIQVSLSVRGGDIYDGLGGRIGPTASLVTLVRNPTGASVNSTIGTISLTVNPYDEYKGTASFENVSVGGNAEFGVLITSAIYQGTYGSFYETNEPSTGDEFVGDPGTELLSTENKVQATADFTFSKYDTPANGTLETKNTDLVVTIGKGAVYLHHNNIPSGAYLTPRVQLGNNGWTELEKDDQDVNRPVTIGGRSVYETRYWLPDSLSPSSTAALQVIGHRTSTYQTLELYDILFAGR